MSDDDPDGDEGLEDRVPFVDEFESGAGPSPDCTPPPLLSLSVL